MLNELLDMLGGDGDDDNNDRGDRGCCQGTRQQQAQGGGLRGKLSRFIGGLMDDDDGDRGRDGCCDGSGHDTRGRQYDRAGGRRDREDRDDGFDFGD